MILIALPAICLFHCAKPAAANTIENDTGAEARIEITYRGSDDKTVAVVAAGGTFALHQPPDQIEAIHFSYADHHCAMTHDQVAASPEKSAVKLVPCS